MSKNSRTVLSINLSNIVKNYHTISSIVSETCEVSAVLKANAYGMGIKNIAQALVHCGCRIFFVANIDEALELKSALSTNIHDIYILHGPYGKDALELCAHEKINVVLNTFEQVEFYNEFYTVFPNTVKSILQVDTGMTRLGISEREVDLLIRSNKLPKIEYLMSHLSSADKKESSINKKQLSIMQGYINKIRGVKVSLSNSSGIFLGNNYHFDMVRPGCALYGVSHKILDNEMLAPVINLDAYIIQKRILDNDQPVGYGCTYNAKAGSKLFTLDIGYADGYPRTLSNNGKAFLLNYELDIVGSVSMDSIVADATCVPDDLFCSATHVELIGSNISIDDISLKSGMSVGEVMSKLGNRLKRVYIQ